MVISSDLRSLPHSLNKARKDNDYKILISIKLAKPHHDTNKKRSSFVQHQWLMGSFKHGEQSSDDQMIKYILLMSFTCI